MGLPENYAITKCLSMKDPFTITSKQFSNEKISNYNP